MSWCVCLALAYSLFLWLAQPFVQLLVQLLVPHIVHLNWDSECV